MGRQAIFKDINLRHNTKVIKRLIIANWKMNPTSLTEARKIFNATRIAAAKVRRSQIVICPPFVYLTAFRPPKSSKFFLGAQDVFWRSVGAHTGEISALMLKNLGVSYCIVGHSERRILGESSEVVSKKVKTLLKEKIVPILCVGERERDIQGSYLEFLGNQIRGSLSGIQKKEANKLIIAYEPIWAIGKTANESIDSHKLHEMVIFIRKILSQVFGREVANKIAIIYGGSVEKDNARDLMLEGRVSGFLVGHASLDATHFKEIIKLVDSN